MSADLFRISLSRELDRSRYLSAILSPQQSVLKRVPDCLRPDRPIPESEMERPDSAVDPSMGLNTRGNESRE
jgi:hypothetical protein